MKVHFISIGGSVMHQLAIALQGKGYQVTGTDDEIFEPALTHLRDKGLLPSTFGWQPDLITQIWTRLYWGCTPKRIIQN